MQQKITIVQLQVPYKSSGNVIRQKEVSFELFKDEDHFSLVPLLNDEEKRLANLPDELSFIIQNGKAVSLRGIKDGNLHVIQDAVLQLQQKEALIF